MSEADATPTRQQRVDHGPEHSQSINTGGEPFPVSGGIRHVLQTYATIAPFIVLVLSVFVFAFIAGSRFFTPLTSRSSSSRSRSSASSQLRRV